MRTGSRVGTRLLVRHTRVPLHKEKEVYREKLTVEVVSTSLMLHVHGVNLHGMPVLFCFLIIIRKKTEVLCQTEVTASQKLLRVMLN